MKRKTLRILLVVFSVAFLLLIGQYVSDPVLYTLKQDATSPFHQNPDILKQISREQSATMLPLMNDVLDATGTLTLNIKLRDFELAERDLETYREQMRSMDNLVINLDMSESELEEFRKNNQKNLQSMQSLLNDTKRFDELQKLEIRYRDENRPDLLYSITYEGEALKSKIAENYRSYSSREDAIVNQSRTFDLNTTRYEESVQVFDEIVKEIEQEQETRHREVTATHRPQVQLSIAVQPDHGVYRDRLQISGTLSGGNVSAQPVTIVLDSRNLTTVKIDELGRYAHTLTIGQIHTGNHLVYAIAGITYSEVRTFTVAPLETNLTLQVLETEAHGEMLIRGSLHAISETGIPVSGAPVQVMADGKRIATVTTNATGSYNRTLTLAEGTYRIKAVFDTDTFPLNASESELHVIEIREPFAPPYLIYALFLMLASVGAGWYLRGRRRIPEPESQKDVPKPPAVEDTAAALPGSSAEPLTATAEISMTDRFRQLFAAGNLNEAAHLLYLTMVDRIAVRFGIELPPSMTPREIGAACRERPAAEALGNFIALYERIRYGGRQASSDEGDRLLEWFREITGGEGDEDE